MRTALFAVVLTAVLFDGAAQAQIPETVTYRVTGTRIAVGQDVRIERDEEVSEAVIVVGGNLIIDGRVRDGVFVAGGDVHLSSTADVRGDLIVAGGKLTRDAGSRQLGSVSYVSLGEWWRTNTWWWPSIRFGEVGRWVSLLGTVARISVIGVLMLIMVAIGRAAVARTGRAAFHEPGRAFLIGLAAEIFFVPFLVAASIGLVITIIGIPFVALLVPIAVLLLVFAFVLGFTSLACRLGEWVEDRLGWQPGNAFIATAIGFVILLAPTLIARFMYFAPFGSTIGYAMLAVGFAVEFIAWTIGLGAAIITGLGRWYTVPPPITVEPPRPTPFDPVAKTL
ncbi:MAG TPA: hypothetical protein VFV51_00105 [Vicinamibacterales bacterium]|nr:hypothetical protein [Vicinamibacterales bacterium]